MTKEELQKKVEDMNKFLQERSNDEPATMLDRMQILEVMMSQAGEYFAECKRNQEIVINEAISNAMELQLEETLSASTINLFVKTASSDWGFLVNSFERINSAAVHQHDGLRTRISYVKTLLNG